MQTLKLSVIVLLFLACSCPSLTAGKKKPQSKPKSINFIVMLGGAKKAAIQVKEKKDVYTFKSKSGKVLTALGYETSTIVLDYSGQNQVMVLATGKGKDTECFYMDATVSKSDFEVTINGQKNQKVTFSNTLSLDGRAAAKSKSQAKKWLKKMSSVKQLCKKARIVELTALDPNADLSQSENKTFVGVDGYIEIVREANFVPLTKPLLQSLLNGNGNSGGNSGAVGNIPDIRPFGFQPRNTGSNSASGGASNSVNNASGGASNSVNNASGGTNNGNKNKTNGKNGKNKNNNNKNKKNNKNKNKNNNKKG